jgi:hypothetical protein
LPIDETSTQELAILDPQWGAVRGVRRLRKDGVSVRGFMGSEGETLESQPNPAGFQG